MKKSTASTNPPIRNTDFWKSIPKCESINTDVGLLDGGRRDIKYTKTKP